MTIMLNARREELRSCVFFLVYLMVTFPRSFTYLLIVINEHVNCTSLLGKRNYKVTPRSHTWGSTEFLSPSKDLIIIHVK